jgi:enoyl-CoA hydratase/carnithine racemase
MTDTKKEILFEVRNHLGFVTLNRLAVLNALSAGMILEMHARLRDWAVDPDIYAIIVRGAGDRAFCAGGDVRAVHANFTPSSSAHRDFFTWEYRLDYFTHRCPKPYIALMDGVVMGGGMGISQGASLRVVTDRTRMAMPEVGIGFFPDVGASYFLSRLPGALGNYLAVTGLHIRAADALYTGLADLFLPHTALDRLEAALATLHWRDYHDADIRRTVSALAAPSPAAATLPALRAAIDAHFSISDVRAVFGSLRAESQPAYAQWASQTVATMATRSPLMMAVTARELERGRTMDLADCFRMELGMVMHAFEQGDFREGVRALLVDKDNAPRWNPPRLEDVREDMIAAFFRPMFSRSAHPLSDLESEASVPAPTRMANQK